MRGFPAGEGQAAEAAWVPGDYYTLGADGFGFSDTRAAAIR